MALYTYDSVVAYDPNTISIAKSASFLVYALDDTANANPLATFDLNGLPTTVRSNADGMLSVFQVEDRPQVKIVSGSFEMPLTSLTGVLEDVDAARDQVDDSAQAAQQASDAALEAASESASLRRWIELGITRRNVTLDPRAVDGTTWGQYVPSAHTAEVVADATDGPVVNGERITTYYRINFTEANTSGFVRALGASDLGEFPVGTRVGVRVFARPSVPVYMAPRLWRRIGTEDNTYTSLYGVYGPVPAQWTELSHGFVTIPNAAGDVANRFSGGVTWSTEASFPAGGTLDVVCVLTEILGEDDTLGPYFDGSTPVSDHTASRWTGDINDSVSEQIDMSMIWRDATAAARAAEAAAKEAATAAEQKGLPPGGLPGQSVVKTGPNNYETAWGDLVPRAGEQPVRLWAPVSTLPPAGSGQQPGDVIFLMGGGA